MIVGFSKHGKGGGSGVVDYLIDEKREGRENEAPEIVRGDPNNTRKLIDSLDFKWKYTSGVLSFAPDEVITPEMENKIIDRFESVAFAGLESDQYNILWVRHSHAGHHELHFATPRIELETGKSLNVKPPGEAAKNAFDDFRTEINARYGLADPDDPARTKNVSIPNHELKIAAEALRRGEKPLNNIRELLDDILTEKAVQGQIRSREDLVEQVKALDLDVTRESKKFITVKDRESGERWRMKGTLYEHDYEPSRTIEKREREADRDYSKPCRVTAERYAERVDEHIRQRAEYNTSRYKIEKSQAELVNDIQSDSMALDYRHSSLNGFISRKLGSNAILQHRDSKGLREAIGNQREETKSRALQRGNIPVQGKKLHRIPEGEKGHRELHIDQWSRRDTVGVRIDRTRTALIERVKINTRRIKSSAEKHTRELQRDKNTTRSYTDNVRENNRAEHPIAAANITIATTSNELNRGIEQVAEALKTQRIAHVQRKSRGLSM